MRRMKNNSGMKLRSTSSTEGIQPPAFAGTGGMQPHHQARLFNSAILRGPQEAIDFITNILESSTEYSLIGKDLDGEILLWNEGARRLYGYEPEEVVGKAHSSILRTPDDVGAGPPEQVLVDTLDAITSDRPYRRALPYSTRRAEINRESGRQVASKVVGWFLTIREHIWEDIRREVVFRSLHEPTPVRFQLNYGTAPKEISGEIR